MKTKNLVIILTVLGTITLFSCKNKDLFEQPTIDVTGFSLQELPNEYTHLNVDMLITNNDKREAQIADASYQVVVEGVTSEPMTSDINKEILVGTPLELTLPLTLKTADAIKLLAKLDKGEKLDYSVTGTFHVDEPVLKRFNLPIDVQGTADVKAGYADFYKQPEVTVTKLDLVSTVDSTAGFTYHFNVTCDVKNTDTHSVTIDELKYTVDIAGIESEESTYTKTIAINGGATQTLTLPVTIILTSDQETDFANAIASGTVDYSAEGTFHAIKVDGATTDFILPLYVTGSISVADMFEQPDITVNTIDGTYTVNGTIPYNTYSFYLNVNTTIENLDPRDVVISEIEYVVTVEGVQSETHYYTDTYSSNLSIAGGASVNLTLPVNFLDMSNAEGAALLAALGDGSADYTIDGTFHAISVDGSAADLYLPLHDTGSVPITLTENK
ncbi:MAG: hypothetical protein GXO80_05895 [Chlorobi bacterium]|nr:hypothetical protein [Chlorobiota bacterium]